MRTPSASLRERSSVAVTGPSSEFSIGTTARSTAPGPTAMTASYDGRARRLVERRRRRADARSASSRERPRRAEEGDAHRGAPGDQARVEPSAVSTASSSSGESSNSASPSLHLLHVDARLVAVQDRGDDDTRAMSVEQRDGARLAARQLAVGVVADERPVGHAAVDASLRGGYPFVEAGSATPPPSRAGRRTPSRAAPRARPGRAAVPAEHRRLSRPDSPQLEREHAGEDQRQEREGARRERHDPVVELRSSITSAEAYGVKVTGKVPSLLSAISSPGTGSTVDLELERLAGRRAARTGESSRSPRRPAAIDSTSPSSSIGRSPPSIATSPGRPTRRSRPGW